MANSHLSFFDPCKTYNALLDRHAAASSVYYEAVSKLMSLAGKQKAGGFAEAKQNCVISLRNCKHTRQLCIAHKAVHGCQKF